MQSIKDKVVVITGASSGIGTAAAKQAAELGAKVVITARREERLQEIVDSMSDADISYVVADVTDKDEVQSVIDYAVEKYGQVDVLFNNASIMPQGPMAEARHDEWKQTLDINITCVLNGIAAALPVMKEQGSGHILVTSSEAGIHPFGGGAVYSGAKAAVRSIMKALQQEERNNNIRTTVISPGTVNTELHNTISDPARREWTLDIQGEIGLTSEDIADAFIYAISASDRVNVNEIYLSPTKTPPTSFEWE